MLDLAIALPLSVLVAAPVLVFGLLMKATAPGPMLYVHQRVGRGGRQIRVFKVRTMVVHSPRGVAEVTAENDARVTAVGRFLRRWKLDELPQLWNVVRGDLSLVGPRPESPKYVKLGDPAWCEILSVRPGIADRATFAFRREEELLALAEDPERAYAEVVLPRKVELWRSDVQTRSLVSYTSVLCRMVFEVFRSGGDEHPVFADAKRAIEQMNTAGASQ